jgi:signal transduction histidine kinase
MGMVLAADVVVALVAVVLLLVARRRRAALAARAAHELRGPLTAAAMALHAARRGTDDATRAPALGAVARQLDRAGRAVDDLERAAAGREPGLRPAPVDLPALLADQAAAWRPAALAGGRALVVAPAPRLVLYADGHLLARALANLLANAVEHGAGTITLAARRRGDRLRLEVRDEGATARGRGEGREAATTPAGHGGGPGAGTSPTPAGLRRPRSAPAGPRGRLAAWLLDVGGAGRRRRGHGLRVAADAAARHGGRLLVVRDGGGTAAILELPLRPLGRTARSGVRRRLGPAPLAPAPARRMPA